MCADRPFCDTLMQGFDKTGISLLLLINKILIIGMLFIILLEEML